MATSRDYSVWVTCPKPNPQARLRLFCFPYAGGGASLFRQWADDMPADIEICPIQPPGRESRFSEPRFTHVPALVEALGPAITPFLTLPFAFFGHSLGAATSFELARYLRRHGSPMPQHLFVSAHRAPQLVDQHLPIHTLPDAIFLEELQRLNGIPSEVAAEADLMELMLPLLRADLSLAETYTYSEDAPLSCPISAFGGLADEGVSRDDMAAWQQQTTNSFTLHMLPGDHFFFAKNRFELIKAIMQDLNMPK